MHGPVTLINAESFRRSTFTPAFSDTLVAILKSRNVKSSERLIMNTSYFR